MPTADWSRRVESGGAFGYYDAYPTGAVTLPTVGDVDAQFNSGLHNSWTVTKSSASGLSVEVTFGQFSSDPAQLPLPKLFDVNPSFSQSYGLYGIDLVGLEIRGDYVKINILGTTDIYDAGNLDLLADRLGSGPIDLALSA